MKFPRLKTEFQLSKETRRRFLSNSFNADASNLMVIGIIGIAASTVFGVIDFFRYTGGLEVVFHRLFSIAVCLGLFLAGKYTQSRTVLRWSAIAFPVLILLNVTVQEMHVDYHYPLFYSNFFASVIIFPFLYTGINSRQAFFSGALSLTIYALFSFLIYPFNAFNQSQFFQVVYLFLVMWVVGVLLRVWRISAFIQQEAINEQAEFLKREHMSLEESLKLKNKLISVLSHDVKAPLNSLKGVLGLLKDGSLSEVERKTVFEELELQVDRTSDFVRDTIEWTKNQMGGFNVVKQRIILSDLVGTNAALYRSDIQIKEIDLHIEIPKSILILADREMANIAVRNVLSNAVKFSPKRGLIKIYSKADGESVKLVIEDRGIGMSKKEMEEVFTWNSSNAFRSVAQKGTQIGMALTRDFMLRNGGDIGVSENGGTDGVTFTMTFLKA